MGVQTEGGSRQQEKIQNQDIEYSKVFFPVVKLATITILFIVVAQNLFLEQMDANTAFHYGDLEEDNYMVQSEGTSKFYLRQK